MFNHSLAKSLEINHCVSRISFSLQYPKLLFPGTTQYFDFKGIGAERLIHSTNPISWLKTANRINNINPEVVIFQYWTPFFAPAFSIIAKKIKKGCGAKILVNCNNIIPHEKRVMDKMLTTWFFNYGDGFIVMSGSVEKDLLNLKKDANYIKTPHPVYDVFGASVNKTEARKKLGVKQKKIILNFGLIRDYKGLDLLIKSAKILKTQLSDFKILVVGECYGEDQQYLTLAEKLGVTDVIDFRFGFVPTEKVREYFCAADLVVLPYKSATQSGVVPIAYHFNTPVIVTHVGGLPEIVPEGQAGYISEPNAESLSNSIIKYFFEGTQDSMEEFIRIYKQNFTWDNFTDRVLELTQS